MTFQKIPHMETDALPSICSGKGCLADAEPGTRHCRPCSQKLKGRRYRPSITAMWKQPVVGDMRDGWLWIYFIEIQDESKAVKIGYATNVKSRLSGLQTSCPYEIKLIAAFVGKAETEAFLHQKFEDSRLKGEWFSRSPGIDRLIGQICDGNLPAYIPGVFRDSKTGMPEIMRVDKEIGT